MKSTRAVGSNQYRARFEVDSLPDIDLMAQASTTSVTCYRCCEIWGGRCQAWVQAPDWAHGTHRPQQMLTAAHNRLPNPDWILQNVELDPAQQAVLAGNPRLSFSALCTLLESGGGGTTLSRLTLWSGEKTLNQELSPGGWTDERWEQIKRIWPQPEVITLHNMAPYAPPGVWRSWVMDPANKYIVPELAGMVNRVYPISGVITIASVAERDNWDSAAWAEIWRRAGEHLRRSPRLRQTALCRWGAAGPEEAEALAGAYRSLQYDGLLRALREQWIRAANDALMRLNDDPNLTQWQAVQLASLVAHEAGDWLDTTNLWRQVVQPRVPRYTAYQDLLCQLAIRNDAPAEIRRGLAATRIGGSERLLSTVDNRILDADTIDNLYRDPDSHNKLTIKNRLNLVSRVQCPPSVLEREARGKSKTVALAAAEHPQCSSEALVHVWQRWGTTDGSDRWRQRILQHPNFPEEYRVIAQLAQ